jgi:hypothetical protein
MAHGNGFAGEEITVRAHGIVLVKGKEPLGHPDGRMCEIIEKVGVGVQWEE